MLYQLSSSITHSLRIYIVRRYFCLIAKYFFVNLHFVSLNLLLMLNKEMVIFSHCVNVISDWLLSWVIMDGKNRYFKTSNYALISKKWDGGMFRAEKCRQRYGTWQPEWYPILPKQYGENDPYYYVGSKITAKDKESRACPSSKCEPKANCLLLICCFS